MIAKRPARGSPALDAFALGTRTPARIVEPVDAEEVAAALRAAAEAGEAVVAWGGGTLQAAANAPARYDVALVTTKLGAVHDYDRHDLTAGVGAGMTLETLQRTLGEHAQFIPFDAPLPSKATVGGTLAAGWAGPRRAGYGRPRDLVIGSVVALADGTLAKSGGMVVKNVTGYDMSKLYVGSHGTLGVLVRANFKVLPEPPVRRLAESPFEEAVRERLIAHVRTLQLPPVAMLLNDGFPPLDARRHAHDDDRPRAIALFEGSEATVERAMREYRSALGAAGVAQTHIFDGTAAAKAFGALVDQYVATRGELSFTLLGRGLPSDAPLRAQRARGCTGSLPVDDAASDGIDVITDLLTGDVAARFHTSVTGHPERCLQAAEALRGALRGRANLLAATRSVGDRVDAWGDIPATVATMRTIKAAFDPHGTLAPGRYLGGI